MKSEEFDREELKSLAVEGAMDWIESHFDLSSELTIGAGSGSTVTYSFSRLADYPNLTAVPTSSDTENKLLEYGVEVNQLDDVDELVFDLDGADEVDPGLNLIKGGGGCHYREKMVAKKSELLIIVVDQSKMVDYLGQTFPLPVEKSCSSTLSSATPNRGTKTPCAPSAGGSAASRHLPGCAEDESIPNPTGRN